MFEKILIANRGEIACRVIVALIALVAADDRASAESSRVPFVGCPGDGQQGPISAPASPHTVRVELGENVSQRLAFYRAQLSPGVLAPRGWQCAGLMGSSGSFLLVAPHLPPLKDFVTAYHNLPGPAVIAEENFGGTSGRFAVAEVLARIFPTWRAFVRSVETNDYGGTFHPVFRPYPADILTRKSDRIVEFATPASSDGLGTDWWLRKGQMPVRGVLIIEGDGQDITLATVRVRLPDQLADLTGPIVSRFERSLKDRSDE